MSSHLLHLLFCLLLLASTPTAERVKRYREFDFNSTRTNYESLRIAPEKDKFIVKKIVHPDSTGTGGGGTSNSNHNKDQYVAVAGDQLLAVNGQIITTMTMREILRQSSGSFMLPLVSPPKVPDPNTATKEGERTPSYQVLKWLRLEIVEAETISFRPQLAARQAKMRRANFESSEKLIMKKNVEEARKKAERKRTMDVEEGEKAVARRTREEQESKHKRQMLQAAKEMDVKQKTLESAEKQRAEGGYKREQARKHSQQKSIAENQKKTIELTQAAAQASAHASQAQRNLVQEDLKKLQEQTTVALKKRHTVEIDKVRERVASENAEHRKASEQIEKERDHQANLAKGDEQARKQLVESIRSEQEAKKMITDINAKKIVEEEMKRQGNPHEFVEVKFRHKGPLGLFFKPGQMPMTIAQHGKQDPPFKLQVGDELVSINKVSILFYSLLFTILFT